MGGLIQGLAQAVMPVKGLVVCLKWLIILGWRLFGWKDSGDLTRSSFSPLSYADPALLPCILNLLLSTSGPVSLENGVR